MSVIVEPKRIAKPRRPLDIDRFLNDVDDHPDTIEILKRFDGLEAEVLSRSNGSTSSLTVWSDLRHSWRADFQRDREQLHHQICDEILKKHSRRKTPGRGKSDCIAVVVLGPPAAGKTTTVVPMLNKKYKRNFVEINPDIIKENLPEYDGWNAAALHEESSRVAENILRRQAVARRADMVVDITGRSSQKVKLFIDDCLLYGYDVHVWLIDLPPWRAAVRVWDRFQKNPFNRDKSQTPGRYVPPRYVYESVGWRPRETYRKLKENKKIRSFEHLHAMSG